MKKFLRALWPFHMHVWKCIHVRHYIDSSYGNKSPSTMATYICETCRQPKEELLWAQGYITVEQLNGVPDEKAGK